MGPFENDDAADWLCDLHETEDLALARQALDAVVAVGVDDYLEATLAATAVAAAVVVAGCADPTLPLLAYSATVWIERSHPAPTADDRALALTAIYRILGPRSELVELYEDTGAQGGIETIARTAMVLQEQAD